MRYLPLLLLLTACLTPSEPEFQKVSQPQCLQADEWHLEFQPGKGMMLVGEWKECDPLILSGEIGILLRS